MINNLLQGRKLSSSNLEKTKVDNNDVIYTLTADIVTTESNKDYEPTTTTEFSEPIIEGKISISLQLIENQFVIKDFHIDFNDFDK